MSNSIYSIKNLTSVYNMVKEIKNHYYETLEGLKEIALGLELEHIILDNTYPYYDIGIRCIEFNEQKLPSCFYVSIDFLTDESYLVSILNGNFKIVVCDYTNLSDDKIYYYNSNIEFVDFNNELGPIYLTYFNYRFIDFSYDKWVLLKRNNFRLSFVNNDNVRFIFKEDAFVNSDFNEVLGNLIDYISTVKINQSKPHEIQFYFNKSLDNTLLSKLFRALVSFFDGADELLKPLLLTKLYFIIHTWNGVTLDDELIDELVDRFMIKLDFNESSLLWNLDSLLNI